MLPNSAGLLHRGIELSRSGRHEDAVAVFDDFLAKDPGNLEALNNRGIALAEMRRFSDALASFERALRADPAFPEALRNKGSVLRELGNSEAALACFNEALRIKPDFLDAQVSRGMLLAGLGRLQEALASLDETLRIAPDSVNALNLRAIVLAKLERYQEALSTSDRLVASDPAHTDALLNRALIFLRLNRVNEALECCNRVLSVQPDSVDGLATRCEALLKLNRIDDALEGYSQIQKLQPESRKGQLNEGLVRLLVGQFDSGFKKYEWRLLDEQGRPSRRELPQPRWIGNVPLRGKSILVHADEGIGDAIQFVRYVPLLADRGAKVTLEVPAALVPLLSTLAGVGQIVSRGDPLPPTDLQCPLLSLPMAFGTTIETIPAAIPYLGVDLDAAARWRNSLSVGSEILVGVCWRGNPDYKVDRERSAALSAILPLLKVPGVRFVSLQKELTEQERRLAEEYGLLHPGADFKGTAELVAALDLVISVDTAWAHWAGAIGKPVWVLLPSVPHWIWLLGRSDSPWYPTARLFRQTTPGDWVSLVANVRAALEANVTALRGRQVVPARIEPSQGDIDILLKLVEQDLRSEAEAAARTMIRVQPRAGLGWKALGLILSAEGHHAEALPAFQRAQCLLPSDPDISNGLGLALQACGCLSKAEASLSTAVALKPDFHEAYCNLGLVQKALGRLSDSEASYRRALDLSPVFFQAHSNLGEVLMEQGRPTEAEASYRRALEIRPDSHQVLNNLARALHALGRYTEAENACRRAIAVDPKYHLAYNNLGVTLKVTGRHVEAVEQYRQALAISPDFALAHNNLGAVLIELGQVAEAAKCLERAVQLKPDFCDAYSNLGIVLQKLGRVAEAEASFRRAIQLKPDFPEAHNNLGNMLQELGRMSEAETSCRLALMFDPSSAVAHSNLLFCLSHNDHISSKDLFEEHVKFSRYCEAPLIAMRRPHANTKVLDRPLRIGFVSGDMRDHAVAYFIEPIFAHLADRRSMELSVYSNSFLEDSVTQRLRAHVPRWNRVAGISDEDLAARIRADRIDILFDLTGHTCFHRLSAFALKPAPIQVSWIGYPGTTGMGAMDYYLADQYFLPLAQFEAQFTEKIVHLPAVIPFRPAEKAPEVNELPALANGFITFGSFNRVSKVSALTIAQWAGILRALPTSRMVVAGLSQDGAHGRLADSFAREGIAPERLTFYPRCRLEEYLALHHLVDMCLDTMTYTGGTTTLHALWMGVPTLSVAGDTPARRQGTAILSHAGLRDFIAKDTAEFQKKAVRLARKVPKLARLRAGLRRRMAASAIGQPAVVAKALEGALRVMWRRWCAGLPPASFKID